MNNAKSDAALYLLTGLIQRFERLQPGTIEEMLEGVKSDRDNTSEDIANKEYVDEIFCESITLLERIKSMKGDLNDTEDV